MKSSKIFLNKEISLEYQSLEDMPSIPGNWVIRDGKKVIGYVEEHGDVFRNHADNLIDQLMVDTFQKAIRAEGVHLIK
jgi:hypothetical protein